MQLLSTVQNIAKQGNVYMNGSKMKFAFCLLTNMLNANETRKRFQHGADSPNVAQQEASWYLSKLPVNRGCSESHSCITPIFWLQAQVGSPAGLI